jgi:mercuric reductase
MQLRWADGPALEVAGQDQLDDALGALLAGPAAGTIGGACVNTGCVPSKALLAAAAARRGGASQPFPGIATQAGPVDMAALAAGKDELAAAMRAGRYVDLAADYGWEIIAGTARFAPGAPGPVLEVQLSDGGTTAIDAGQYLVATGAAPWIPPVSGLAETGYLTSATAMELTELPESMLVIGGNATGLELAQLFARLGVKVTIAETLDRLAPSGEPEISAAIEDVLAGEGIGILTAASVVSVRRDAQARSAVIKTAGEPERELACGQILVAAGRRPVTAGLNLDAAGVTTGGRGEILADEFGRTANPRIWAAGDVTGGPQFVYVAAAQGSAAARGRPRPPTPWPVPDGRWITPRCPGSSSPARRSPRPGSPKPGSPGRGWRAIAGCCRCRRCRARSSAATRAGWSSWWPRPVPAACAGCTPWPPAPRR